MNIKEVLQDIIRNIPTANIPTKFITMVKLRDKDGNRHLLKTREQLEDFFRDPNRFEAEETRLVIDSEGIHKTIMSEVDIVFEEVDKLQQKRFQ